jgi:hypothetical protein
MLAKALQERHHLEERLKRDGSLFDLGNSTADEIVTAISGNIGVIISLDKVETIAKGLLAEVKRKRQIKRQAPARVSLDELTRYVALRRLCNVRADLHARVLAGELTPHSGMIQGLPNRAARHADVARFRQDAGYEFVTYLIEVGDPRLDDVPLLRNAARWWLDSLSTRGRHCFACGGWLGNQQHVGALLLATAATNKPTSASTCGVCRACWSEKTPAEIEAAALGVLRRNLALQGGVCEVCEYRISIAIRRNANGSNHRPATSFFC